MRTFTFHAYHGTTSDRVDSIAARGFDRSEGGTSWLGAGIYFFESAPMLAMLWGQRWAFERGYPPAVIEARIEIAQDEIMDLLDVRWWKYIHKRGRRLTATYKQRGPILTLANGDPLDTLPTEHRTDISEEEKRSIVYGENRLDCAAIDSALEELRGTGRKIRAVRAAFLDGAQLYRSSFYFKATQVQINVRDPAAISSFDLVDIDSLQDQYRKHVGIPPWPWMPS